MTKSKSKAAIGQENISKLVSIGIAAMEHEDARRRAYMTLQALRRSRRIDASDTDLEIEGSDYALVARQRKNSRERLLRMIASYRKWLAEVNGGAA